MSTDPATPASSVLQEAAREALRAADEVRELLDSATDGDLEGRIAAAATRLDASRNALEQAARATTETVTRVVDDARAGLREDLDGIEHQIRANPLATALVCGIVGLAIGLAIARRR